MINIPPSSSAQDTMVARLAQLYTKLKPHDVSVLRENRSAIQDFLRLGKKWGFFELNAALSGQAGWQVLRYLNVPESHLAALIGSRGDADSLAVLESQIDEGLQDDPKFLARMLIERTDREYQKQAAAQGTSALTSGNAAADLEKESDPALFLSHINLSAPKTSLPSWFLIVDRNEMSPADLEAIYERMDREDGDAVVSGEGQVERARIAGGLDQIAA